MTEEKADMVLETTFDLLREKGIDVDTILEQNQLSSAHLVDEL